MAALEPSLIDDTEAEVADQSSAPALEWPLLEQLPALLEQAHCDAACCQRQLQQAQEELKARFLEQEPVEGLVRARAAFIDALLRALWQQLLEPALAAKLTLVAVGGYGRGELHPYSDVDLLMLVPAPLQELERVAVERLVSFLWDIGLEVGHSVRTVAECAEESSANVGVMTTLLESRRLAGSAGLIAEMRAA